jgi:hypothetical protein
MKTVLLSLSLFVVAACSLEAQPQLELQDTVNWGKIVPEVTLGDPAQITQDVTLKNIGTSILHIKKVETSCGCTSAPLDKDSLAPGEETKMRITLNLPHANGPLSKTVTVLSDDPAAPSQVLHLLADVQRPFQLSSSFIPFNKGKVGDAIEGVVTISNNAKAPVTVSCKSTSSGLVILTPMPLVMQPGTSADLKVTYTAKTPGAFSAQVYVKTDLKGYETFDLMGYGMVDP